MKRTLNLVLMMFVGLLVAFAPSVSVAAETAATNANFPKAQTAEDEKLANKFAWWPTDAKPGPYKDPVKRGYWWWPEVPGEARPWGNQGYIYVLKIIYDYKSSEGEMKPSLIIKRIIREVKVYFDYDKSDIRPDTSDTLDKAIFTLEHNLKADILITGNADTRGSEQYNLKLAESRAESVRQYLQGKGLPEDRIKILSRGKMDAIASKDDIVGMQKDRNVHFMIAEVEEVNIPASKAGYFESGTPGEAPIQLAPGEEKVIEDKKELVGEIKVGFKEYTIQKGDTLWAIAEREYGNGRQWKRIYDFNTDVISNPDKPKRGTVIRIPQE